MAEASTADNLTWSQSVCTLAEAIVSHTLPVLVRVEESSSGHQDSVFSQGDILKLDSIQWIPCVQACSVTRKLDSSSLEFIHTQDTINIPLGYKGLLRLTDPNAGKTVYNSFEEVLNARPRYVRTMEPVIKNGHVVIDKKCDLEITIRAQQVVCIVADNSYVLDEDTEIKFLHLPDDSLYTLKEVSDRYQFPQYVSFINNDYTECVLTELGTNFIRDVRADQKLLGGTFQLRGIVQQDLVVGRCIPIYEDPCEPEISPGCENVIVIRPDSSYVKHVHVVVCHAGNSRTYESFLGQHFPWETELEQSLLDETIIMDFIMMKDSRSTVVNKPHPSDLTDLGQTADFSGAQEPTLDNISQDSSYMGVCFDEDDDHFYTVPETPEDTDELKLSNSYHRDGAFVNKAKALFSKLKLKDKVQTLKSKIVAAVKQPETSDIPVNVVTNDDYIFPERSLTNSPVLNVKPSKSSIFRTETQIDCMRDGNDADETDYIDLENIIPTNAKEQTLKEGPSDLNNEEPSASQEYDYIIQSTNKIDPPDKVFASLSVTGLANLLVTCGLDSVATFCVQEKVDGCLLSSFTDDDLGSLFSMSKLQIKKLRMAQNHGWTPHV